jgi:glycosyltransferase involved in cell wall biosynthesis
VGWQAGVLAEAGAEPTVIALSVGRAGDARPAERTVILDRPRRTWRLDTSLALRRVLRDLDAQVIFSQGYDANVHCCLAKLLGAPGALGILHITPVQRTHRAIALRLLRHLPAAVVFQSQGMMEHYQRLIAYPPERCLLLPNGVDVERFSPAVSGQRIRQQLGLGQAFPVLVCVARLHLQQKAHDVLLAAFRRVAQEYPEGVLLLCGGGGDEAAIRGLARRWGLERRVYFLGRRDDVPEILAAADIFVLLSRWESDCNAVREAAAAAKPIVTTFNAGTAYLADGEHALLVPPDDPEAAAQAILRLAAEPQLRARLGAQARELMVNHYTQARQAAEFVGLVARLAAEGNASPRGASALSGTGVEVGEAAPASPANPRPANWRA